MVQLSIEGFNFQKKKSNELGELSIKTFKLKKKNIYFAFYTILWRNKHVFSCPQNFWRLSVGLFPLPTWPKSNLRDLWSLRHLIRGDMTRPTKRQRKRQYHLENTLKIPTLAIFSRLKTSFYLLGGFEFQVVRSSSNNWWTLNIYVHVLIETTITRMWTFEPLQLPRTWN